MLQIQRMWNVMRVLKTFSIADVRFCNGQDEPIKTNTAKKYIKRLQATGYLLEVSSDTYKLMRNTGGIAPGTKLIKEKDKVVKIFVKDFNTGEILPLTETKLKPGDITRARLDLVLRTFKDKEFKVQDINKLLNNEHQAKRTLKLLREKGLIMVVRREKGNRSNSPAIFRLISKEGKDV